MREAGIRTADEVRGESLNGDEADQGEVTINVDGILKLPETKITATTTHNQPTDPFLRLLNRDPGQLCTIWLATIPWICHTPFSG
jgi:hypothetical protein